MSIKKEIDKKDAIVTCKQIINMGKYEVVGHETIDMDVKESPNQLIGWEVPKKSTDILVIYLKK